MYSAVDVIKNVLNVKKLGKGHWKRSSSRTLLASSMSSGGDIINTCRLVRQLLNVTYVSQMECISVDLMCSFLCKGFKQIPKSINEGYRAGSIPSLRPTPSQVAQQYIQNAPYVPSLVCKITEIYKREVSTNVHIQSMPIMVPSHLQSSTSTPSACVLIASGSTLT